MRSQRGSDAVRPLRDAPPQYRERGAPRLFILAVVLVAGITTGWLLAGRGAVPVTTDGEETVPGTSAIVSLSADPGSDPSVTVEWTEATAVPAIPPGWRFSDHSGVVEACGAKHIVIQLRSPDGSEAVSQIWSSDDGLEWQTRPLDLGTSIADPRLTATDEGLLLTGRIGSEDAIWQSTRFNERDGFSWARIELQIPDELREQVIGAAVAGDGDTVISMSAVADLWPQIVSPFLPEGIDLESGSIIYQGDEFLRSVGDETRIRLFAESPQVLIVDGKVWVRILTPEGEEVMRTVPLPPGTYPLSVSPRLSDIQVTSTWASSNGEAFVPVIAIDPVSNGCFYPSPLGDGFVGSTSEADGSQCAHEATVLWTSDTGHEWELDRVQPPVECTPFSLVASGETILLTSVEGTQCWRGPGTDWVVLDEPCTTCYKMAGHAGFLGYPTSFEYNKGLLSHNGVLWNEIPVPGVEPYPTLAVLDDSLVAMSVLNDMASNHPVRIWLGTISST